MTRENFKRWLHRLRVQLDSEAITVYSLFAVLGLAYIGLAIRQHEWTLALCLPAFMLAAHAILCADRYLTLRKQVAAKWKRKAERRQAIQRRLPDILLHVAHLDGRGQGRKLEIIAAYLRAAFPDIDFGSWKGKWPVIGPIHAKGETLLPHLTENERAALFEAACHVVFADDSYSAVERDHIHDLFIGLSLPFEVARRALRSARQVYLDEQARNEREREEERQRRARKEQEDRDRFKEQWHRTFEREPDLPPRALALAELGLPENATRNQIKARFRKLAKQWHPDMHLTAAAKAEAAERFKRIEAAYRAALASAAA